MQFQLNHGVGDLGSESVEILGGLDSRPTGAKSVSALRYGSSESLRVKSVDALRSGSSESAGSGVGKTFQIDSDHEFPMLHRNVKSHESSTDDLLHNSVHSCKSIVVATDNQQGNSIRYGNSISNSNGKSNAVGGTAESRAPAC